MSLHFLDTSAFVKLLVAEAESPALIDWIAARPRDLVASDLMRVEAMRVCARYGPEVVGQCRSALRSVTLLRITDDIVARAAILSPATLRSLDAVHVATALALGADVTAAVVYDARLTAAFRVHGVEVIAPGAD